VSHRAFKDRLYAEFATIGKALASPHRLELLDLRGEGERSVDELAQEAGLSLANASAHLQVLRQARMVESDKRGLQLIYRLGTPEVFQLWRTLRDLGTARLAEVDRLVETYIADRASLDAVDIDQLRTLLAEGGVTLVDVRPQSRHRSAHDGGAVGETFVMEKTLRSHHVEWPGLHLDFRRSSRCIQTQGEAVWNWAGRSQYQPQ
jgi:DNA-binding transcriptional ArsR family regulator